MTFSMPYKGYGFASVPLGLKLKWWLMGIFAMIGMLLIYLAVKNAYGF